MQPRDLDDPAGPLTLRLPWAVQRRFNSSGDAGTLLVDLLSEYSCMTRRENCNTWMPRLPETYG